jgi:hypothetical protein
VAKKRNHRRGWRGFGRDTLQLFDFARFLYQQMIAFVGIAHYRDRGVIQSALAPPSASKTRATRHARIWPKVPPSIAWWKGQLCRTRATTLSFYDRRRDYPGVRRPRKQADDFHDFPQIVDRSVGHIKQVPVEDVEILRDE